jgi:hypothetical protein
VRDDLGFLYIYYKAPISTVLGINTASLKKSSMKICCERLADTGITKNYILEYFEDFMKWERKISDLVHTDEAEHWAAT